MPSSQPPAISDEALARALNGGPMLRLDGEPDLPALDGAAAYVATSGSTSGRPSVVALSGQNLHASASATLDALGGGGAWLLTVPPEHIAGLMVRVRAWLAHAPVVAARGRFRASSFAADLAHLAQVAGGGRQYCSLVPTQLVRVLADPAATEAARGLDAILVGGAATAAPLLARARGAGLRVVTTYGMTETAGGCVYDGVPLAGIRVGLGEGGRITLRGPQVALGYVRPDGLAAFDGVFTTADRGRWVGGVLEVLGRVDDVVVSGGVNVDPAQVESVIVAVDGVAEVAVIGVPDAEWGQAVVAAVVAAPGADRDGLPDVVRAAVRERLGAAWTPQRVVALDELPLRGPGKVDRRALLTLLR